MRIRSVFVFAIPTLVLALVLAPLWPRAQTAQGHCVLNAHHLVEAIAAYAQDHDGVLPPMDSEAAIEAALAPYVRDKTIFKCPETHLAYRYNGSLGGTHIGSYPDRANIQVLQDSKPHADGKSTIAYLDDYVTFGGVDLSAAADTVDFAHKMALGVSMYAQDYDERLPPISGNPSEPFLDSLLLPYVRSSHVFVSPSTHNPFQANAAIGEKNISELGDIGFVVVLHDPPVHAGGKDTVAFLDGHVEQGGTVVFPRPEAGCLGNVRQLAVGALMYAQDYDGVLPPMNNYPHFQTLIYPYVRTNRPFSCPVTGLPYALNSAVGGVVLSSIADPAHTLLIQDSKPHPTGTVTSGYVDGHVRRR